MEEAEAMTRPLSPQHRANISAGRLKGKKRPTLSPEHRAAISAGLAGKRRSPFSPEHRDHLAEAHRGMSCTPETRAKMSYVHRGNQNAKMAPIKGECVYCGAPATTYDHVIPISRGGSDTADNMVVACVSCNPSKGNRTPEEWWEDLAG